MIVESLAPVFALILIGKLLVHFDLTARGFAETSDRLVYYFFFPALLFWKIGGLSSHAIINWPLTRAAVCTIATVWLASLVCVRIFGVPASQAGAFSQSTYRANTYIGMAVVINALGEEQAGRFGIFLGLVIPFVNVLAVSTLIWFAEQKPTLGQRLVITAKALLGNPLILACIAGLAYASTGIGFPPFLDNTLQLAASVSLPLALISIGGALSPAALKGRLRPSVIAAVLKVALLPVVGWFFLRLFDVSPTAFRTGMIFFALPIAPSAYVLAVQLGSDRKLSSAAIVLSTVLGLLSLPVVMLLF